MVSGSGPASMSQTLRTLLSEDVGPFLEWLADMARSKEDGEAPALTAEDEQRVRMARSRTRVRGSRNGGCFASHLVASLNRAHHVKETLMAIGNVIDGQPDDLWETLVSTTTQNNPEYFRGQAWAMRRALISHPDLALRILPEQAERALDVLRDGLLGLRVEDAKMRSHFAIAGACNPSSLPLSASETPLAGLRIGAPNDLNVGRATPSHIRRDPSPC